MSVSYNYQEFTQTAPSSWQYGAFAPSSKMQNEFIKELYISHTKQRPMTSKPKYDQRRLSASRIVADEEYYRAYAQFKTTKSLERLLEIKSNRLDMFQSTSNSQVAGENLKNSKLESSPGLHHVSAKDKNINTEYNDLHIPRETMYLIDKVVRKRVKEGPFGVESLKGLFELLKKQAEKASVNLSLEAKIEREKRVLEKLRTPAKQRPKSAVRKNNKSAPPKQPESRIKNKDRFSKSEKKSNIYDDLKPSKLDFNTWKSKKDAEERMKAFLIKEVLANKELFAVSSASSFAQNYASDAKSDHRYIGSHDQSKMTLKSLTYEQWLANKEKENEERKIIKAAQNQRKKELKEKQRQDNDHVFKEWLKRTIEREQIKEEQKRHDNLLKMKEVRLKEDRDQRQKLDAKIAYKEWVEYKKVRVPQEKAEKQRKLKLAEMVEKQKRHKRKHEDTILAYTLNTLIKKKATPKIPQPRKTKLI